MDCTESFSSFSMRSNFVYFIVSVGREGVEEWGSVDKEVQYATIAWPQDISFEQHSSTSMQTESNMNAVFLVESSLSSWKQKALLLLLECAPPISLY